MSEPCYYPQSELGLIRVAGPDARAFLQAQTTQSILDLPEPGARRAAWLSAKGRVRALFDVVADGEDFWLITPADNCDYLSRQLRLFILRARLTIDPAPDQAIYSLYGAASEWLTDHGLELDPEVGQAARCGGVLAYRPGPGRIDLLSTAAEVPAMLTATPICDPEVAALKDIALGIPEITAELRERYVPQMLNLDRLAAISFTKGCYPGQEIVARTQNLGQVKRRLQRFTTGPGERPVPGAAIVDVDGAPVGEVNRVAASDAGFELLAVVAIASDPRAIALAADGRKLAPRELPSLN
jgi:hypothetical protein